MVGPNFLGVIVLAIALMLIEDAHAESAMSSPEGDEKALDSVLPKNGSRILGNVTSAREGTIVIETNFAGAISIDTTEVLSMHTEGSMVVLMADGSTIRDQPIAVDRNGIEVTMPNGELRTYGVTEFDILSPEP